MEPKVVRHLKVSPGVTATHRGHRTALLDGSYPLALPFYSGDDVTRVNHGDVVGLVEAFKFLGLHVGLAAAASCEGGEEQRSNGMQQCGWWSWSGLLPVGAAALGAHLLGVVGKIAVQAVPPPLPPPPGAGGWIATLVGHEQMTSPGA